MTESLSGHPILNIADHLHSEPRPHGPQVRHGVLFQRLDGDEGVGGERRFLRCARREKRANLVNRQEEDPRTEVCFTTTGFGVVVGRRIMTMA